MLLIANERAEQANGKRDKPADQSHDGRGVLGVARTAQQSVTINR